MGGGLMQLVAYGAQDVYLTGNPQITFFQIVYRRHTNFSIEAIKQDFEGTADFGSRSIVHVSRNGDLLSRIYLEHDATFTRKTHGTFDEIGHVEHYGHSLIKECDILHYHGQAVSHGYRDLVMWSGIMGKPVILHHHGSEIRNKDYPKFANDLVKYRYVSTPDLLEFVPNAEWLPNPVDIQGLEYSEPDVSGPLKILHAPTNRDVKNTKAVETAISALKDEGLDIQFTIAEDKKHSELIEIISGNDLVVDWLNPEYGIYGVFSIESMALGRTVICSLNDSLYDKHDVPIISIPPTDLADKIKELYNNRNLLVIGGKSSYDFVQSHHNPIESAKKVIERYKAVLD